MLVLFETPGGFALFKVLDEGKLSNVEDLGNVFSSADSARKMVKLKAFDKFDNTSEALEAVAKLLEGAPSKGLRKFLKANCEGETLAVADSKLGNIIKEKLKIDCVHNNAVMELLRGVRSQLSELISGLGDQDLAPMSLGLSHSLARYKLKFSSDKVDTMIIQAIGLLDDLDKELNTYAMRVREWYGWHFPELAKIISDNILYAKSVKLMGNRINAAKLDFSEILVDDVEAELKEASVISMGTEVSDLDLMHIRELCDQVLSLAEYRAQLYDYLKSRMNTIAPNLTALVGELVGARLISHGGSLLNLSKQPGSTVQILGAEKALFRALKTKHNTPKYGLIYHASVVGQAGPKNKAKIARSLAAKAALAIRCDALGDSEDNTMGVESRLKLETRLRTLEGKDLGRLSGSAKGKPKIEVYDKDKKIGSGGLITPAKTYNTAADSLLGQTSTAENDGLCIGRPVSSSDSVSESRHQVSTRFESKRKEVKEETVTEADTISSIVVPVAGVDEIKEENEKPKGESKRTNKADPRKSNPPKHLIGEQVVAGWPSWLSEICGEALNGWLPRKADSFEKIEKIGSGTYSNVYKAKDLLTGNIVALKKVRCDVKERESLRFMAREILILRRLDHPNVIKLEGLVTSRMSSSLYLVFRYMHHDLAGLVASPDIKFTKQQVKCYMKQLLSGLEHCHSRGVLHRDIKGSNLLIDDEGVLKIGDFGLATCFDPRRRQQMTNRVVTLWYRAPELLHGVVEYGFGIDLWSAGCILGELLTGRPIMPGRTEVEQLHRIYKLCGSPSEEYWRKIKLPSTRKHAQHRPLPQYKRRIREVYKDFSHEAVSLMDTLLALDPAERKTAASALMSDFFTTYPLPCQPFDLPKYPPTKEIDAKRRDEEYRRLREKRKAHESGRGKTRPRERAARAMPVPEANAEVQSKIDRMRMITHANAKSKSDKFPPPHQDGLLGYPMGLSRRFEPSEVPFSSSSLTSYADEPLQMWSGPLAPSGVY
ncbi:hypothetical protein Bca52824_094014 [Brassica carinata]|uniref:Nucleolar protein 58 n=1 Tax=Brassica carinata TaxID=52824 RepID=A0A8X7TK73_BRACI|nr:hypothetical protein Bca52824_094014 [Brassica carinata]